MFWLRRKPPWVRMSLSAAARSPTRWVKTLRSDSPSQIGAGRGRGQVELRRFSRLMRHRGEGHGSVALLTDHNTRDRRSKRPPTSEAPADRRRPGNREAVMAGSHDQHVGLVADRCGEGAVRREDDGDHERHRPTPELAGDADRDRGEQDRGGVVATRKLVMTAMTRKITDSVIRPACRTRAATAASAMTAGPAGRLERRRGRERRRRSSGRCAGRRRAPPGGY